MERWPQRPDGPLFLAILLFVLAVAWVFSLPIRATHTDFVRGLAYFEDHAAQESIATVQAQTFTPFQGPLALGNHSRPLWLKVQVGPAKNGPWVLMVQPNFTQQVEVWQLGEGGQWQSQRVGLNLPYADRAVHTLAPTVPVSLSEKMPTTLFVKVTTPSAPVFVRVLSMQEALSFNTLVHLVLGLLLGIGLLTAVISYLLYRATGESLWLKDCLFNVLGIAALMLQMGLASKAIAPFAGAGIGKALMVMNAVYTAYAIYFYTQIFRLYRLPAWAYWPFQAVLVMLPVLLTLIALGHDDWAMQINNTLIFICTLFAYVVIVQAKHEDSVMLWTFRVGYSLSTTSYVLAYSLPLALHQQTNNMMSLYPGLSVTVFTLFMLMVILARHTQLRMAQHRNLALEKQAAEQQLAASLKHHEETSSFLGMLLHEVKNPLSTIRMSAANLELDLSGEPSDVRQRVTRVKAAAESIDAVLERGVEIDQFVQAASHPALQVVNVADWLASIVSKHEHAARFRLHKPSLLPAAVDQRLTDMMVTNLLDNAAKYAAPQSPIVLELSTHAQQWRLAVVNKVGPVGLPDQAQLFTKYYRSSLAMNLSGLGLGLYWVRGIARQLGGDVHYQSHNDQVVFTLCLPV